MIILKKLICRNTTGKTPVSIVIISFVLLLFLENCSINYQKTDNKPSLEIYRLPDIPVMLANPEDRADYLALHYWDHFDFSDRSMLSDSAMCEQIFVDYLQVLSFVSPSIREKSISSMLDKASGSDTTMLTYITGLGEKYLYGPNSPMRNEELYIPFLEYIVSSPNITEANKIRPQYRLNMASKNRCGQTAADFTYTLASGKKGKLSEINTKYILLYFNNPDCSDCKRVKQYIASSIAIKTMLSRTSRKLTVLSVYPDEDTESWLKEEYPDNWINSFDAGQFIRKNDLYDLKAIPTFYLLDENKQVLMKDAAIEEIEKYLISI